MSKKNKMYILIIFLLFMIDQLSKSAVKQLANSMVGYSTKVIGDFLRITYVENHGGIFGIFQGEIRVFTILSTILIIYVVSSEFKNFSKYDEITKIGVLFIVAGALGNMSDRFFRGYVIDMIDFRTIWQFVFNIADAYIHIGIYIIIIASLIKTMKKRKFGGK